MKTFRWRNVVWKIFNYIVPYLLLDFLKHIIIFLLYKIKGMPGKIKTEISKIGQMNISESFGMFYVWLVLLFLKLLFIIFKITFLGYFPQSCWHTVGLRNLNLWQASQVTLIHGKVCRPLQNWSSKRVIQWQENEKDIRSQ